LGIGDESIKNLFIRRKTMELSYLDQFNAWSLSGGHMVIKETAVIIFITMALIVLGASLLERNKSVSRTATHEILLFSNWIFGTLVGFGLIVSNSLMLGLGLLSLVYLVTLSREMTVNAIAPFLSNIPNLFWNYKSSENRQREKILRNTLYRLFRVPAKT
jgi:hypothetical protein